MEKRRIRGSESEAFKKLHVAADILDAVRDVFRERAGMVKNGRRDLALAATLVNKTFVSMLETVPTDQLITMQHNVANAVYMVGVKRADKTQNDKDYGMWVSWETLNRLIEGARDCCMTCDRGIQEQRQCPLAKAFDTLPADKDNNSIGCGWFGRV